MKRLLLFLPAILSAQLALPIAEEKKEEMQIKGAAAATTRSSEILIIDPAARAKDLQGAFQFIRQSNPGVKLSVKLTSGEHLTDILSIDPMEGGTLVIFKLNTLHGVKYQVEKIENIDSIIQS